MVQSRQHSAFPLGTFLVNVVGSLVLGLTAGLVSHTASPWLYSLVGTGFCGALTTFSTFTYETVRLIEEHAVGQAVVNGLASVAVALGACAAGYAVVSALF
jgi:fluoride exporter